jgi:oligopeptide transport system ATP-binding protein
VPDMMDLPGGCPFHARCSHCYERCLEERPPLFDLNQERQSACFLVERGGSDAGKNFIESR